MDPQHGLRHRPTHESQGGTAGRTLDATARKERLLKVPPGLLVSREHTHTNTKSDRRSNGRNACDDFGILLGHGRVHRGSAVHACKILQDYLNHLHSNVLRCVLPLGCLVRLFGEALGVYILAVPPLESRLHCSRDGLFLFSHCLDFAL